jgi:uncharacterized spore protein YtfJ
MVPVGCRVTSSLCLRERGGGGGGGGSMVPVARVCARVVVVVVVMMDSIYSNSNTYCYSPLLPVVTAFLSNCEVLKLAAEFEC